MQVDLQELREEEKLAYASGNDGSPLGHIYLEGYPEAAKDTITIRIIDHRGNITEKVIEVQVSNNEIADGRNRKSSRLIRMKETRSESPVNITRVSGHNTSPRT